MCRFHLKFIYTAEGTRKSCKIVVISFWGEIFQIQTKKPRQTFLFDSFAIYIFFSLKAGLPLIKTRGTINASTDEWISVLHFYKGFFNTSNLCNPNQHLPHLFQDLTVGCAERRPTHSIAISLNSFTVQ